MKQKLKKMLTLLLCVILIEGVFPISVFAGHDDGQDCPYCGHYHWDDYMCPDCGGCSNECTNSDCYEKNHCPECGVCRAAYGDDYFCPDCGLCYACATDDRPDHCVNCGLEGTICPGCNVCDDCISSYFGEYHCKECGACLLTEEQCSENHPGDPDPHCTGESLICEGCGNCMYGAEDNYCEYCHLCAECYADMPHCIGCGRCTEGDAELCEGSQDIVPDYAVCVDCCKAAGWHCSECDEHVSNGEWCPEAGEGSHCLQCVDDNKCIECDKCFICDSDAECPDCGLCRECCIKKSEEEGCIHELCVESSDYEDHLCPECSKCSGEDPCNYCGRCENCAETYHCKHGICPDDPDWDDHVCSECGDCFEEDELCEFCKRCENCREHCEHDVCPESGDWDDHHCKKCGNCLEEGGDACKNCGTAVVPPGSDYTGPEHEHTYDKSGHCTICGKKIDGPYIMRQPKNFEAPIPNISTWEYDLEIAEFTVRASISNHNDGPLTYQWYRVGKSKDRKLEDFGDFISGSDTPNLKVAIEAGPTSVCIFPQQYYCVITDSKGRTATTKRVTLSATHLYIPLPIYKGGYIDIPDGPSALISDKHAMKCHGCEEDIKPGTEAPHSFGKWKIEREATDELEGYKTRICSVCKYKQYHIIDKLEPGHVHEYNIINNDDVYHWTECSCGKMLGKTNPEKHTYGAWTETKAPTEAEYGTETRSCTFCGHEQTQKINKLPHNHEVYTKEEIYNLMGANAGTWKYYDKNGTSIPYDPDTTVSGEYIVDGKAVFGVTIAAHWFACKSCDNYRKFELHQYSTWRYVSDDASGDMIFNSECLVCSHPVFRKVIKDTYPVVVANGKALYEGKETLSGKTGQTLTIKASEPVGNLIGKKFDHWNVIKGGVSLNDNYSSETTFTVVDIPKTSDNLWSDYMVEIEAVFTDCNHEGTGRIHSGAIAPTCTAKGKEDDTLCEKCMEVLEKGKTIPAKGHGEPVFDSSSVRVVYCNQKGAGYTGNKVCPDCGEILEKGTATKKIHICVEDKSQLEIRNAKPATCSSQGYTGDEYCKGCNSRMDKGEKIDKLDHTFGEWTITIHPKIGQKGKKIRVCSGCGVKDTAIIPALGTKYSVTVNAAEHGMVAASKLSDISTGEEITLTVSPDSGYELSVLSVKDSDDNEIALTDDKFIMPESDVKVSAEFIKSEEPIPDVTYTIIGGGIVWTKGSSDAPVLTAKRSKDDDSCFNHFKSVEIDGTPLTLDTDYTAKAGSTIVTLKPSALEKLDAGMHTITMKFDDGEARASLTIKTALVNHDQEQEQNKDKDPNKGNEKQAKPVSTDNTPNTGDSKDLVLWLAFMILSLTSICGVSIYNNQKIKKTKEPN